MKTGFVNLTVVLAVIFGGEGRSVTTEYIETWLSE
jgi:hypothetical protein